MRVLDLFCGAGGAAMGLHHAWPKAEIVGVDIKPQKHYPFTFVLADAMTFSLSGYDFIWASPPCQAYSIASRKNRNEGTVYPDLIDGCRSLLQKSGIPFVIENVPGSPVRADFILCGSNFGLPIVRHRIIETSFANGLMPTCSHVDDIITICGHGTPQWMRKRRIKKGLHPNASVAVKRAAMEIPWMNREELSQAIPPAYSEYIARQYLARRGGPDV